MLFFLLLRIILMEVLIKVNNSDPVIYSPSLGVGDGCD